MTKKGKKEGSVSGLRFPLTELVSEIDTLQGVAGNFLDPGSDWVLHDLREGLEQLRTREGGRASKLRLGELRTKARKGAYEVGGRRGSCSIFARITGVWELCAVGEVTRKTRERRQVAFCGIASTKAELLEEDTQECLSMWRFELGAFDSPGCYFHVQVLGESDHPPFPKALPIPRLPSIFVTPMAAIEYVLGELFQDQWEREVTRSGAGDRWRGLQRGRLRRLLVWQGQTLDQVQSSPWMALKAAKPPAEIFLRE